MAYIGTLTLLGSFFLIIVSLTLIISNKYYNFSYLRHLYQIASTSSNLLLIVSFLILLSCFCFNDFQVAYVTEHSQRNLSLLYKISAIWSDESGSLFLWLFLLSLISLITQKNWQQKSGEHCLNISDQFSINLANDFAVKINLVIQLIRLAFLIFLIFDFAPFQKLIEIPTEGKGLNLSLQTPWMLVHPTFLLLGYSTLIVPFATVIAELWGRKENLKQLNFLKFWLRLSWLFLTIGIISGGRWAYTELGWGGYWNWDPVENVSLLPWLITTALLHTLIIQKDKKRLKVINYSLILLSFLLTIFGAFITRSETLESVHTFRNSKIELNFLILLVILLVFSSFLFLSRLKYLTNPSYQRRFSFRELSLLLVGIVLFIIFLEVFLGTIFPFLSSFLIKRKLFVSETLFNQITIPLWLLLIIWLGIDSILNARSNFTVLVISLLIGVVSVVYIFLQEISNVFFTLIIGVSSFSISAILLTYLSRYIYFNDKNWIIALKSSNKKKLRKGFLIIHIGVIILMIGIAGRAIKTETLRIVIPGEMIQIGKYNLVYKNTISQLSADQSDVCASLEVYQQTKFLGVLNSHQVITSTNRFPHTSTGIMSMINGDIYFVLIANRGEKSLLQINLYPLTCWVWIGGFLLPCGMIIILSNKRQK